MTPLSEQYIKENTYTGSSVETEIRYSDQSEQDQAMVIQGGLRMGWGYVTARYNWFYMSGVSHSIIKSPDSYASSQSGPTGPQRMDTGKALPSFMAAWHLLSLTAVSMLL